jgi:hypothetical protein
MPAARTRKADGLALKAMAYSPWSSNGDHLWPKCWHRPIDGPVLTCLALRFTSSENVTAAIPPGGEALFRIAMEGAAQFTPLSTDERKELAERIKDVQPLFKT